MKYRFFNQHVQECNSAMIKALQNLATQLETECCQESRLVTITVKVLSQIKIYHQQSIAAIENEIYHALDSD